LDSVLKADVWRDHLLQEEIALNEKLAELEAEGDDKRFVDAREEASSRLAEVHARLADMEAESGPARAAALLAGMYPERLADTPSTTPASDRARV
jgi:ATP-binding cassette subfamily F protein 3